MHVLVTGGAGYIGMSLCEELLDEGHEVTVLDRLFFGMADRQDSVLSSVRLIRGDLRNFQPHWLDGIDAVAHLGGLSNDPTADYNPDANWQMNTVATEELVAACKRKGIRRFTFASSASIYDCEAGATLEKSPTMCDETTEVRPRGAYSISKKAAEDAILAQADDTFSPVIFRQGTVHGFSRRMRFDLVVNTFLKDAIVNKTLYLHGGGWMWRPLVSVKDVARVHALALRAPIEKISGQIFNVHEENYQIRQLAMLVAGSLSMIDHPIDARIVCTESPSVIRRNYRMSNAKLSTVLGFTPSFTVLESIDDMLRRLPIDRKDFLLDPRWYNVRWMTMIEEVHMTQSEFASIY